MVKVKGPATARPMKVAGGGKEAVRVRKSAKKGARKRGGTGAGEGAIDTTAGTREAMFQSPLDDGRVRCNLCHQNCELAEGKTGICRVRKNIGGTIHTTIYGLASAVNLDPVEKKPFFHFHPGAPVLSYGTVGCNFRCRYCQNHSISQCEASTSNLRDQGPAGRPAARARELGCRGIAWTYNEPTIWYEYMYDASKVAKKEGLWVALVSNGYMKEAPLRRLAPYMDAINIDVKGFDAGKYMKVSGAKLEKIQDTCRLMRELDIHLEISYLIIPGHNDSKEEMTAFCRWVSDDLGPDTPVHFLRFHPDYKWAHKPATSLPAMLRGYQTALREGLNYPYLGNISNEGYEDTRCPACDALVIQRKGHSVVKNNLRKGKCPECGGDIPVLR
jgi:pyruvate formate lyase activating enzyme